MPSPRDFLFGPWRAVSVLGVTQILAWGAMFYPPVLTMPLIAADRGWSIAFGMGGFSLGLLTGGLVAPYVGRLIDRFGGHAVMPVGSLAGALGLLGLVLCRALASLSGGVDAARRAMAANLYDAAFATLGRIFGAAARRPITVLTLAGGFASTVSWPVTHLLIGAVGWRGTYLVYAALLACVAAPLHAFALPRMRAHLDLPAGGQPAVPAAYCRQKDWRSFWSRRPLRRTPSCRRLSPRICLRSSIGLVSSAEPSSPSGRCSGRRRWRRGYANSSLPATCIRWRWRGLPSQC